MPPGRAAKDADSATHDVTTTQALPRLIILQRYVLQADPAAKLLVPVAAPPGDKPARFISETLRLLGIPRWVAPGSTVLLPLGASAAPCGCSCPPSLHPHLTPPSPHPHPARAGSRRRRTTPRWRRAGTAALLRHT